jgi:hypothetical protein
LDAEKGWERGVVPAWELGAELVLGSDAGSGEESDEEPDAAPASVPESASERAVASE